MPYWKGLRISPWDWRWSCSSSCWMMVCYCLITACQRGIALLLTSPDMNVAMNALKNVSFASMNQVMIY
ncbi:hypothetical protein [Pseudanabaena galeata]|uniref:hypothetical protein n=1 Tax=Pseudanabaena galeata TaxID=1112103 RepID=UPI002B1FA578|nr:hypothetical protein [Pseudanabaena galeata]